MNKPSIIFEGRPIFHEPLMPTTDISISFERFGAKHDD